MRNWGTLVLSHSLASAVAVLAIASIGFGRLHAQATTATILGAVTDTSGAAVPDAMVQVTNVGTRFAQNTVTNAQGRYRVPELGIGEYEVQVSKNGFQTVLRKMRYDR